MNYFKGDIKSKRITNSSLLGVFWFRKMKGGDSENQTDLTDNFKY